MGRILVAVVVVASGACTPIWPVPGVPGPSPAPPGPGRGAPGGAENVAFVYHPFHEMRPRLHLIGRPLDPAPTPLRCTGPSCLWVRRFEAGMVVVSAYGTPPRSVAVPLGVPGCRRVTAHGVGPVEGGRCVTSLTVHTGAPEWGHIYLYR